MIAVSVSEREKHEKDMEKLRKDNAERGIPRNTATPSTEVHVEMDATNAKGDEVKAVEVHAFGGYAYVNTHGEARLDQDGVARLRKALDRAFQAVS